MVLWCTFADDFTVNHKAQREMQPLIFFFLKQYQTYSTLDCSLNEMMLFFFHPKSLQTLTSFIPHNARFMTDAARREHEALKKKVQPKLSLSLTGNLSRSNVSTPSRHTSGNLTPPVTPPITPSSSFRSSTPTGNHNQHTSSSN